MSDEDRPPFPPERIPFSGAAITLVRGTESLRDVAQRVGIHFTTIQKVEAGSEPRLGTLEALVQAYQTTISIEPEGTWIEAPTVEGLRARVEAMLGAACLTDSNDVILAASRWIAAELGFDTVEELRGLDASRFVLEGRHIGDDEQDGVALVRRLDGSSFRFRYHVVPHLIGGELFFLADGYMIENGMEL